MKVWDLGRRVFPITSHLPGYIISSSCAQQVTILSLCQPFITQAGSLALLTAQDRRSVGLIVDDNISTNYNNFSSYCLLVRFFLLVIITLLISHFSSHLVHRRHRLSLLIRSKNLVALSLASSHQFAGSKPKRWMTGWLANGALTHPSSHITTAAS